MGIFEKNFGVKKLGFYGGSWDEKIEIFRGKFGVFWGEKNWSLMGKIWGKK